MVDGYVPAVHPMVWRSIRHRPGQRLAGEPTNCDRDSGELTRPW